MTKIAKITLMFVVFIDLIGQGLVFPIINALIMDTSSSFLPQATSDGTRHFYYGLIIGCFFLSWFLGVVYVARLSDSIGRKNALVICLIGALLGYALTIVALWINSLLLLIIGRCITGFTAGNQPIAQAAVVDASTDAADRDRNMGYIVTGISLGLVGGPIIGAILSDKSLLGSVATYNTPFYAAFILVAIAIVMVMAFFKDSRAERLPFVFRPRDITDSLIAIKDHPSVLRLMPVYSCFMIANLTFYVFMVNYLTSAFGYGVIGGSVAMIIMGSALAFSSTFLVAPAQARFKKPLLLLASLSMMVIMGYLFVATSNPYLVFVPPFLFYLMFGIAYPTILGLFSESVSEADQGWVMGVTTAVFTLAGGVMSLIGGALMSIDIKVPYFIVIGFAVLGLVFLLLSWRNPGIQGKTSTHEASADSSA
ncbi:MAG: MFS transporter [Pseudomonadota bacterium]